MPRKAVQPQYFTVKECQSICRYKCPEPIRRAIAAGALHGFKIAGNKLLIPNNEFWKWFRRKERKELKFRKRITVNLLALEKMQKELNHV